MVRKCASFAFGLALIVALGFAMAHAQPLKAHGGSTGFSTPCEPASPASKATSALKVVSTIDSNSPAENAGAPTSVVRGSRVEAISSSIPPTAPLAYLLNGMLVVYGTVLMGHYGIVGLGSGGSGHWLFRSMLIDIALVWVDFLIGKALFECWLREA